MLKGKKILVGVTGSIAAYKIANLIRLLHKAGAETKVLMTEAAKEFVAPLTLATLSKNEIQSNLATNASWANHVALGRWADVMVIAPLSCNTLAKMANGICDNLVMAVYLSATCKVLVAPAMDEDMWIHPSTQNNIATITTFGNIIIPVQHGELASGLIGEGRMAEPEIIIEALTNQILQKTDLASKKILITAGPTYEPLDPVRYIGNYSSGKMGVAIAQQATSRGAVVTLILGPTQVAHNLTGITTIHVQTAQQMYEAAIKQFETTDVAIMSAAVADYTPKVVANKKIKKSTEENFEVQLTKTKDILKTLGHTKSQQQIVVGFALETNNEKQFALQKLETKNADYIILNSTNDIGGTFGSDNNKITIFDKAKKEYKFTLKPKLAVANDILNTIFKVTYNS